MPKAAVPAEEWTEITTTSADTIFENKSSQVVWISTEDVTSADLDEGVALSAGDAIVIGTGQTVSASTVDDPAEIFYMALN